MTPAPARSAALAARLCAGAAAAWPTLTALASFALPLPAKAAALAVMALTAWRPVAGLTAAIALAPAGALLAPPPARAAELLVWAFLAAWLLSAWRPIGPLPSRATTAPALLFALCAAASWLAYIVGGAAGVEPHLVPALAARAVPSDHLVYSSPEPETFALLPLLAGLALFASGVTLSARDAASRIAIAAAIAASAAVLAVATIVDVLRQWGAVDYGAWFLLRYVRGERFSLHLADLNAAGSHYVLGILVAVAFAAGRRTRRAIWAAMAVLIVPALWISGSRSASVVALLAGGLTLLLRRHPVRRPAARHAALAAVVVAIGLVAGALLMASGPAEQGTASNALRLRSMFLVTSARMFASAPAFGVGIGHYHERSNEFMPPALRQVYRHENAHNYFAQQFAELGAVGGLVFVWLAAAIVWSGWRAVRAAPAEDAATIGLFAGTGGYLLTCISGHPLLVPEAAVPFWGACGVLVGGAPPSSSRPMPGVARIAASLVVVAACLNVAAAARRYALATAQPGERGFYGLETSEDESMFVWMTRHGVFYVGPQPGTVSIPVRGPDFMEDNEPFRVTVEVAGRHAGVYEAPPDRWTTIEVPLPRRAALPFRRIDLRANRSWSPMRDRGERADDEPRSVRVGETLRYD